MARITRDARRGVPKNFTLEADACVLLAALSPNAKGFGRMLSELIRKEYDRRAERLAQLPAVTQEGLAE